MHVRLSCLAQSVRRHSLEIVRSCVRNCECLCAYKLHRAQQVYHRLWGVPRSRTLLRALRSRTLLGATTLAIFNWDAHRISDSTLSDHYRDVEEVKALTLDTLTCRNCGQRLVVDIPAPGIKYCNCENSSFTVRGIQGAWIPFIERKDLLVWRREKVPKSGMFEYKLYGAYPEVSADVFFHVQLDPEYRMEWDKSAVQVHVVDVDPKVAGSEVLYWEMKWPRFFSNRDYVFNRRFLINHKEKVMVIRNEAVQHPKVPEDKQKYRVKEYYCTMVVKPFRSFEEPGVEFCMTYFDNPGLSLPTPVQTWVATSAMPDFLLRLRNASIAFAKRKHCKGGGCKGGKPLVVPTFNEAVRAS